MLQLIQGVVGYMILGSTEISLLAKIGAVFPCRSDPPETAKTLSLRGTPVTFEPFGYFPSSSTLSARYASTTELSLRHETGGRIADVLSPLVVTDETECFRVRLVCSGNSRI
jgi:hypothetical protein